MNAFALDPTHTGVFAATESGGSGGLFSASDFGASKFTRLDLPVVARSLAVHPGAIRQMYAAVQGGQGCGVAVSDDGGETWHQYNLPGGFQSEELCHAQKNVVVASAGAAGAFVGFETLGGVHRSVDGGRNWTPARVGLPDIVRALVTDPGEPATLWAGTPEGVFSTTDAGATWRPLVAGLTTTDVRALAIDPQRHDVLYAGTRAGVFKSVGGRSWTRVGSGIDGFDVRALAIDSMVPTRLLAGAVGASVFRLEQDPCGDGVIHPGERPEDEVRCVVARVAVDACPSGGVRHFPQRRLARALLSIERSTAARMLRRVDRLLKRVRARARRLARRAHIIEECLAGIEAGVTLSRGAIGDALRRP